MIPKYCPFRSIYDGLWDKGHLYLIVTKIAFWSSRPFWFCFIKFGIFENFGYLTILTLVIPNFCPFLSISYENRNSIFSLFGHFEFFISCDYNSSLFWYYGPRNSFNSVSLKNPTSSVEPNRQLFFVSNNLLVNLLL